MPIGFLRRVDMKKKFISIASIITILMSFLLMSGCPAAFIGWRNNPSYQPSTRWVCDELDMYFVVPEGVGENIGEVKTDEGVVKIKVNFSTAGHIIMTNYQYGTYVWGGKCKFEKNNFTVTNGGKEYVFVKEKIE